jgi:hypothetical protein
MADSRAFTPTADTTGIRLPADLSSSVLSIAARCDASFRPSIQHQPVRFEYNAVLSRCDKRGFPYPFFLDSVRCHA